jgi:hypothetical protein
MASARAKSTCLDYKERPDVIEHLHDLWNENQKEKGCIVLLNGFPGVGKLTIARAIKSNLPEHATGLTDNHVLIDPAEAIAPGRGAAHKVLHAEVRRVAFEALIEEFASRPHMKVIMTGCLADNAEDTAVLAEHLRIEFLVSMIRISLPLDQDRQSKIEGALRNSCEFHLHEDQQDHDACKKRQLRDAAFYTSFLRACMSVVYDIKHKEAEAELKAENEALRRKAEKDAEVAAEQKAKIKAEKKARIRAENKKKIEQRRRWQSRQRTWLRLRLKRRARLRLKLRAESTVQAEAESTAKAEAENTTKDAPESTAQLEPTQQEAEKKKFPEKSAQQEVHQSPEPNKPVEPQKYFDAQNDYQTL